MIVFHEFERFRIPDHVGLGVPIHFYPTIVRTEQLSWSRQSIGLVKLPLQQTPVFSTK